MLRDARLQLRALAYAAEPARVEPGAQLLGAPALEAHVRGSLCVGRALDGQQVNNRPALDRGRFGERARTRREGKGAVGEVARTNVEGEEKRWGGGRGLHSLQARRAQQRGEKDRDAGNKHGGSRRRPDALYVHRERQRNSHHSRNRVLCK